MAGVPARSMLAALLASVFAGVPASASDKEVRVELTGRIEPSCSLAPFGASGVKLAAVTLDLGDLTNTDLRSFRFTVNCNFPFEFRMASAHGGLQHEAGPDASGGLTGLLPYTAESAVDLTGGGQISLACGSGEMRAGNVEASPCFVQSGNDVAINETGRIRWQWSLNGLKLLGGKFEDTMTIYVGPQT